MKDCPACAGTGQIEDDDALLFHFATLTDTGWGLEHPWECRPNLAGCEWNAIMERLAASACEHYGEGRYRVVKEPCEFSTVTWERVL